MDHIDLSTLPTKHVLTLEVARALAGRALETAAKKGVHHVVISVVDDGGHLITIDDHSRLAFAAILPDQKHTSAILFFHMARAHFSRFGFFCRRVLTDNGSCYRDGRFRMLLNQQNVRHRFTRPYTPRTNGKAERLIQTAMREWAYARSYQNSAERQTELDFWTLDYNFHRPHARLNLNPPVSRAGLNRNNLLSLHS